MSAGAESRGPAPSLPARLVMLARARPGASLLVLLAAAGLLYVGLAQLWPSDRRRIKTVLDEAVESLAARDLEGVMTHVSPYFSEEGIDRERLRSDLERITRRRPLDRANLAVRHLTIANDEALMDLHVTSFHGGGGVRFARSEWTVRLEKIDEEWLVRSATPERVNGRRIAGLRAVLSLGL